MLLISFSLISHSIMHSFSIHLTFILLYFTFHIQVHHFLNTVFISGKVNWENLIDMLEISRSFARSFLGSWTPACNACPVFKQTLAELRSDQVRCNIFPSTWLTTHGRDCARPIFRRGRLTSLFDLVMFTDSASSASLALSSSSSIVCVWFSCFLNSARANTDFFAGSNTSHLRRQMCWGQWLQ